MTGGQLEAGTIAFASEDRPGEPPLRAGVYLRMRAALTALLLAMTTVASAQLGVDFSGRWTLQSAVTSPEAARALTIEQPLTSRNVRGDDMPPAYLSITIRRESDTGVSVETRRLGVIGGTVSGIGARDSTRSESVWKGNTLVLFDGIYSGEATVSREWSERREEWSIGSDGLLTIDIMTQGTEQPRRSQRLVYLRSR